MNKLCIGLISTAIFALNAYQSNHIDNLDSLIKQLRLKTYRAELIDTPALLQTIIQELYMIQNEFQSLSLFTHQILQNLSDTTASFNAISEQMSNIIPERQITATFHPKKKPLKKKHSLSRSIKVIEKYQSALGKNIRDIATVNKILQATLIELESIQQDINALGETVRSLALSFHHQAKDLFTIALKLFTLAGIESETGPYLCQDNEEHSE